MSIISLYLVTLILLHSNIFFIKIFKVFLVFIFFLYSNQYSLNFSKKIVYPISILLFFLFINLFYSIIYFENKFSHAIDSIDFIIFILILYSLYNLKIQKKLNVTENNLNLIFDSIFYFQILYTLASLIPLAGFDINSFLQNKLNINLYLSPFYFSTPIDLLLFPTIIYFIYFDNRISSIYKIISFFIMFFVFKNINIFQIYLILILIIFFSEIIIKNLNKKILNVFKSLLVLLIINLILICIWYFLNSDSAESLYENIYLKLYQVEILRITQLKLFISEIIQFPIFGKGVGVFLDTFSYPRSYHIIEAKSYELELLHMILELGIPLFLLTFYIILLPILQQKNIKLFLFLIFTILCCSVNPNIKGLYFFILLSLFYFLAIMNSKKKIHKVKIL